MSNVSETSFYGHQARLISWSRPTVSIGSLDVPYDITTFISTAVERGVDFVPISRMAGLKPLGGGATAHIAQSIINLESSFALKHIQFPDSDHPKETDIIRVATVELMVLTHPEVKKHPNVLALEGATWDFQTRVVQYVRSWLQKRALWETLAHSSQNPGTNWLQRIEWRFAQISSTQ